MKKWQLAITLMIGLIFLTALGLGTYWLITRQEKTSSGNTQVTRTQEEKELEVVKGEVEEANDLDFEETDELLKDLEAIDLSGV